MRPPVEAVNDLTQRWLATADGSSTVLSGFGLWPLLGYLAEAADRPGRDELQAALGVSADDGVEAANEILAAVASSGAVKTAVGLWTQARLPVNESWSGRLPAGAHEVLTGDAAKDKERLDSWARENTDGLIERFPAAVDERTVLLLASSLLVKTRWIERFTDSQWRPEQGAWAGRTISALTRTTGDLDQVRVVETPSGPLTVVTVAGADGIDVHLVLGEEARAAGDILAAGVSAWKSGAGAGLTGSAMEEGRPGPGIVVSHEESRARGDKLSVGTVRFHVTAEHDLLKHGELFGLVEVRDASRGHFPGISPEPLAVDQARQAAMAEFTAEGFKAAAITALSMVRSMAMAPAALHTVKVVTATFDRPFAFYAVHRETGLILAAGWVADPESAG